MEALQENPIYAEKDGITVSINDVERGLACGCICPLCKARLIARKGEIKRHHFAHHAIENCGYNFLYSLYLSAEKLLKEEGFIQLQTYGKNTTSSRPFKFDAVEVKKESKPRFTISRGDRSLEIIFFSTTSEYNRAERQMCELDQSAIAVDVSDITFENAEKELRERLLKSSKYQRWLHNSRDKAHTVKRESKSKSTTCDYEPNEVLPPKEELTCPKDENVKRLATQNIEKDLFQHENPRAATTPVKKIVDAKAAMKSKLLGERSKEIFLQRVQNNTNSEYRDPRYIRDEVRAEYDAGQTEWAKNARAKVEKAGI